MRNTAKDLTENYILYGAQPISEQTRESLILRADTILPGIEKSLDEVRQKVAKVEGLLARVQDLIQGVPAEKRHMDTMRNVHDYKICNVCHDETFEFDVVIDGELRKCLKDQFKPFHEELCDPLYKLEMIDRSTYTMMMRTEEQVSRLPQRILSAVGKVPPRVFMPIETQQDSRISFQTQPPDEELISDFVDVINGVQERRQQISEETLRSYGIRPSGFFGGYTKKDHARGLDLLWREYEALNAQRKRYEVEQTELKLRRYEDKMRKKAEQLKAKQKEEHRNGVTDVITVIQQQLDRLLELRTATLKGTNVRYEEILRERDLRQYAHDNILAAISGR